jgi:hypothetical protein
MRVIENLLKDIENRYVKNKFVCCAKNIEELLEIKRKGLQLFFNSFSGSQILYNKDGFTIIDIEEQILNKSIKSQIKRDFIQYFYVIYKDIIELSEEEIISRFTDDYKSVLERMFFRKELIKEGWDIEKIEIYISQYYPSYKVEIDSNIYDFYYNMINFLNIVPTSVKTKKGRPNLSKKLKEIIKIKRKETVKDNMKSIYMKAKMYDKIKEDLLSEKEVDRLEKMFDKEDELFLKLKKFFF